MAAPVIEVQHLSKRYGSIVAIEDLSFEVEKGEIFGILGPNGAGKTTAVECLEGLREPHGGRIRVRFSTDHPDVSWLREIGHVSRVVQRGRQVEVEGAGPVLALVAAKLVAHGIVPADLRAEQPSLEDVFLEITGDAEDGSR